MSDLSLGNLFENEGTEKYHIKLDKNQSLGISSDVLFSDDQQDQVELYIYQKIKKASKEEMEKIFSESNVQKTNKIEQIKKKLMVNEINQEAICGFSTSESNIKYLKDLNFEKNFIIQSPEEVKNYNEFYNSKSLLLKAFQADNIKDQQQKKESLFQFIDSLIEQGDQVSEKTKVGLDSGFKFVLTMIRELKELNPQSLLNSLKFIYETLKNAKQGSFYGIDRLSFMIDANLNEVRSFFLSIIEDYVDKSHEKGPLNSVKNQILELIFKNLIMMGVIRSNVEDLLLVGTLLDKYKLSIDLSEEIGFLSKDDSMIRESLLGAINKKFSDNKIIKSVPVFYFSSGKYSKDKVFLNEASALACDGYYIYIHQGPQGLFKIGTGYNGTSYGQVYLQNQSYRNAEQVQLVCLNEKLFCRSSALKDKPFVIINPYTLQEESNDFANENHPLRWIEEKDNEKRSYGLSPLFTDGFNLYTLTSTKEGENKIPIVEIYQVGKDYQFKLIRSVQLKVDISKPFVANYNNSFATNGQQLYYQSEKDAQVYDLESGLLIEIFNLQNEQKDFKAVYDPENNVFYQFPLKIQCQIDEFKILNFKKQASSQKFIQNIQKTKDYILKQCCDVEDNKGDKVQIKQKSLIQMMIKSSGFNKSNQEEQKKEENKEQSSAKKEDKNDKYRTYILSLIFKTCLECNQKLEEMQFFTYNEKDTQKNMLKVFKYPNSTFLSTMLFELLQNNLQKYLYLIEHKQKFKESLLDQYSLYFILSILSTNFQSMIYCNITLPEILDKVAYYNFIEMYKTQFVKLISESSSSQVVIEDCEEKEEMKLLWEEIHKICLKINAISINFFYQNNKEIIEKVEQSIKEIETKPSEIDNVCVLMNHLTGKENSRLLLEQDLETITLLQNIYEECCKIKTKHIIDFIKNSSFEKEIIQNNDNFNLIIESGKFIKVINEQLLFTFMNLIEKYSHDLANVSHDIKLRIASFQKMILKCFEIAATELSIHINEITNILYEQLKIHQDKPEGFTSTDVIEKYYRYSGMLQSIFTYQSDFYYVVSLYQQQFSMLEVNFRQLPTVINSLMEIFHEVNYYYKTMKKFSDILKIQKERDAFKVNLDQLSRRLCRYIGQTAYKLIRVVKDKKEEKKDPETADQKLKEGISEEESLENIIIQSNLLAGGIDNKFLHVFSEKAVHEIKEIVKITRDEKIDKLLQAHSPAKDGEYKNDDREQSILTGIINEGQSKEIDMIIKQLQKHIERRNPASRLGGAVGMKLTRAAFALLIKFSEYFEEFVQIVDITELRADEMISPEDTDHVMGEILSDFKNLSHIHKRWEKATSMRKWLNEKKSSISHKVNQQVKEDFQTQKKKLALSHQQKKEDEDSMQKAYEETEEKKGEEEEEEVIQIDTSTKNKEEEDLDAASTEQQDGQKRHKFRRALTIEEQNTINDIVETKCQEKITEIVGLIMEKAEFLVKLNVSQSLIAMHQEHKLHRKKTKKNSTESDYKFRFQSPRKQYQGEEIYKEQKKSAVQDPNQIKLFKGGVNQSVTDNVQQSEKLQQWKDIYSLQGSIQSLSQKKEELIESSITSILACLQLSINTTQIKEQVEKAFIKGAQRNCGLKMIGELLEIELPYDQKQDLINWFCAALRDNTNKITHYLDDLMGCGEYLENECKKSFFSILRYITKELRDAGEVPVIVNLLKSLQWKYSARDHFNIQDLQLLHIIHKGSQIIQKCWGRLIKSPLVQDDNSNTLSYEVISMFENIFMITLSRIIKPDVGSQIRVSGDSSSGASLSTGTPSLFSAHSLIDTNISEKLIHQALDIIFLEFERYNKIINKFEGIEWQDFQSKKGEQINHYMVELLDEYDEEEKNQVNDSVLKQMHSLYSQSFLKRLIRLLWLFTSIASNNTSQSLSMIYKVAQRSHLITLINLFLLASPRIQIIVLKILQNLINVDLPFDVFEEAIAGVYKDSAKANQIKDNWKHIEGLEESHFLKFLYSVLLELRNKLFNNNQCESEGSYIVIQELQYTLREILTKAPQEKFQNVLKNKVSTFLSQSVKNWTFIEQNVILNLLPNGTFKGLTAGADALLQDTQKIVIVGFTEQLSEGKTLKQLENQQIKDFKLQYYCTDPRKQQAIVLLQGDEKVSFSQLVRSYSIQQIQLQNQDSILINKSIQYFLSDPKIIQNFVEIINTKLNNDNFIQISTIQAQIIKIILNQIENDNSIQQRQSDHSGIVDVLKQENLLHKFYQGLQNIVQDQKLNNDGAQLPVDLLEMKISIIQQQAVESNYCLQSSSAFELQAILYNCQTITIHDQKTNNKSLFLKHYQIHASINENKAHSLLTNKSLSIEFFKSIKEHAKDNKQLPNIVIMEVEDLYECSPEVVCEVFNGVQAIITSNFYTPLEFITQFNEILNNQKGIDKSSKPIFVLAQTDLLEIKERHFSSDSGNADFSTQKQQIEQLQNKDLLDFGGYKKEDITEFKQQQETDQKDASKGKLAFMNYFLANQSANENEMIENKSQKEQQQQDISDKLWNIAGIKNLNHSDLINKKMESFNANKNQVSQVNIQNLFHKVYTFKKNQHEKEFQKDFMESVSKLLRVKSIKTIMTLLFSDKYFYNEIFEKELTNVYMMISQIFNESIDIKNQVGDITLLKKFKELITNIVKDNKNIQIIQNIFNEALQISIPNFIKKVVEDETFFIKEIMTNQATSRGQATNQLLNPYFVIQITSTILKIQPDALLGQDNLENAQLLNNLVSTLLALILISVHRNNNIYNLPMKALKQLIVIFSTIEASPKNYIQAITLLSNNKFIENIRKQVPTFQNSKKSEAIKLWREIFYYYQKIQLKCNEYAQNQFNSLVTKQDYRFSKKIQNFINKDSFLTLQIKKQDDSISRFIKEKILLLKKTYKNHKSGIKVPFMAKIRSVPDSDTLNFAISNLPVLAQGESFELFSDPQGKNKLSLLEKGQTDQEFLLKNEIYLQYTNHTKVQNILYAFGNGKKNSLSQLKLTSQQNNHLGIVTQEVNLKIKDIQSSSTFTVILTIDNDLLVFGTVKGATSKEQNFVSDNYKKILSDVRMFSVGRNSIAILKLDNTILFMGRSKNNHFNFANIQAQYKACELYQQEIKSELLSADDQVVFICNAVYTTFLVTKLGKLFQIGQPQQEAGSIIEVEMPSLEIKVQDVYTSKSKNSYCVIIKVRDNEETYLMSMGHHEKGLLGQGQDVKESNSFKKLQYDHILIQFEEISIQYDHALALSQTNVLYGWGSNWNNQLGNVPEDVFQPIPLFYFSDQDKFAIKGISSGFDHSLLSVLEYTKGEGWENKENKVYYLGINQNNIDVKQCEGQGISTIVKFDNVIISNLCAGFQSSFIQISSIDGTELYKPENDKNETFYERNVSNEINQGEFQNGILHFYLRNQSKLNQDGIKEEEEEKQIGDKMVFKGSLQGQRAAQDDDIPEVCLAVKHSILDFYSYKEYFKELLLQAQNCVDVNYSHEEVDFNVQCDDSKERIQKVWYYAVYKEGQTTKELNLTQQAFHQPTEFDVVPALYYRLTKPLKEGAVLPVIDIAKLFFSLGQDQFQFQFTVNSSLFYYSNKEVIKALVYCNDSKNQALKDIYLNSLSMTLNKDLVRKTEDFLVNYAEQEKLKGFEDMLMSKEKEMKEYLTSKQTSKPLDEFCKKILDSLTFLDAANFNQFSTIVYILVKYYNMGMKVFEKLSNRQVKNSIQDYLPMKRKQFIQTIPGLYKNEYVKTQIASLPTGSQVSINIRRRKAMQFAYRENVDHEGKESMFGQMMLQIKSDFNTKVKCYQINKADSNIFKVYFKGEGGSDHGGLYRDFITCLCNELQSKVVPLLIPTPNNKSEHGENREAFLVNPSSTRATHIEMFKYFGYLLGMAIRSEQYLPLDLAPIFWKQLLDEQTIQSLQEKEKDLKAIDIYQWQHFQYLRNKAEQLSDEEFNNEIDQKFITQLSDGSEYHLKTAGTSIKVTKSNLEEYIKLSVEARMNESKLQIAAIVEGINFVIPRNIYVFFNWKQLETRATGSKMIDLEQLEKITSYDSCSRNDEFVKYFWQALESFTNQERSLYIKFVWGRTRLLSIGDIKHTVSAYSFNEKSCLPKSATCFFKIYLPKYPNYELCRKSLLTAIQYCGDIDNDRQASGDSEED